MNKLNNTWQTFGHNQIKTILSQQISTEKYAHAYIFFGKAGLGKLTLANEFAGKILQTHNLKTQPDYFFLDGYDNLNLEKVREFFTKLSLKPLLAKKKVAILNGAEKLNLQSSNALLKTLEEAPLSTIIILIYSEKNIIPTIASRCQIFNFLPLSLKQLQEFATIKKIPTSKELLTFSGGSPAKLQTLTNNQKLFAAEQEKIELWQKIKSNLFKEKYSAMQFLADKESEDLQKYFYAWLDWETQNLPQAKYLENLRLAISGLKKNYNKKMILQNLINSD